MYTEAGNQLFDQPAHRLLSSRPRIPATRSRAGRKARAFTWPISSSPPRRSGRRCPSSFAWRRARSTARSTRSASCTIRSRRLRQAGVIRLRKAAVECRADAAGYRGTLNASVISVDQSLTSTRRSAASTETPPSPQRTVADLSAARAAYLCWKEFTRNLSIRRHFPSVMRRGGHASACLRTLCSARAPVPHRPFHQP